MEADGSNLLCLTIPFPFFFFTGVSAAYTVLRHTFNDVVPVIPASELANIRMCDVS